MARPGAEILLTINQTDMLSTDILTAQGLYAVLYQDKPINVKNCYWSARGQQNKYTKSVFANQAPAKNLAKKLNDMFYTCLLYTSDAADE